MFAINNIEKNVKERVLSKNFETISRSITREWDNNAHGRDDDHLHGSISSSSSLR